MCIRDRLKTSNALCYAMTLCNDVFGGCCNYNWKQQINNTATLCNMSVSPENIYEHRSAEDFHRNSTFPSSWKFSTNCDRAPANKPHKQARWPVVSGILSASFRCCWWISLPPTTLVSKISTSPAVALAALTLWVSQYLSDRQIVRLHFIYQFIQM